jgi:hypothetical protein
MAATYVSVPRSVPSQERTALITGIVATDVVDVVDVLGRPARGVAFNTTDSTDTVSYRLNNSPRILKENESSADEIVIMPPRTDATVFTSTGLSFQTVSGLEISSFQITALTLLVGTTITATVW